MKEHTLHFFMLFTFIIFVYASVMQGTVYGKETTKFSTQQVRELWQICATSFRNINPGIGQNIYFPVCDCYVDHMRSTFTPKQVEALSLEQTKELGKKMNIICPVQLPFTIKEFT